MTYIRYVMKAITNSNKKTTISDPFQQSQFNSNGFSDFATNVFDAVLPTGLNDLVDNVFGA